MIGVPTGFIELDELTNGLHPGQMIVIAARPAVGEVDLGIDIARAAAIKHNLATAVFSLEMSRTEIPMRILSAEATIQLQDLRKGLKSQDQWNKLARIMGKISRQRRCSSTTAPTCRSWRSAPSAAGSSSSTTSRW